MTARRPEPHTLAGAYAMDALDGPDRAWFERHLARCQECTREVSGLREATARLAAAATAQPPPALKERLRAETSRTRQLPPVTAGSPATGSHRTVLARAAGSGHASGRLRPRAWLPRLGLALAAAAVAASIAVWATGRAGQPARPAPGGAIAAVLTAPDATMFSAQVRTGGTATVVMSSRERMLVFAAAGLRALPASECYELWLVEPGQDRPAGLLPMVSHGMAGPVVASGLRSGDRLGLTVEPSRGSGRPTSPMLVELTL